MRGDEFIVLDYQSGDENDGKAMYRRIRRAVEEMIISMNYDIMFTVSCGIVYGEDLQRVGFSEVMKRGQFALDMAKKAGRNQSYVFDPKDYERSLRRSQILQEIRKSVRNDFAGFQVVYQPIVDVKEKRIYSAEALLRYTRESGERIAPSVFIPILEESGLIVPVGKWVMKKAADVCKKCRRQRLDFRISLNISPVQFEKSTVYADLKTVLDKNELPYDAFVVEVTESHKVEDTLQLHKTWSKMHNQGFAVAIDDFGTGYSNFNNITIINPNMLKLDRSFTLRAVEKDFDRNLMKNIIDLAHQLGMQVCVEGVELATEVEDISALQPDLLQGFFFGKPAPAEEFLRKWGGGIYKITLK